MRNKIIEHGSALSTMFATTRCGIRYRRKNMTFGFLSNKDRASIIRLIEKYGAKNMKIKSIAPNPYMMLDEFLETILEDNVKLERDDLTDLGNAVKHTGGLIDAVLLAKHLRKFLDDTAAVFAV